MPEPLTFDARSEKNLKTLLPGAERVMRRLLRALLDAGLDAKIISGTRTYAEQQKLYNQGRNGNPGPIVTNAPPGHSNHNFGLAIDIGLFNGSDYLESSPLYNKAGAIGKAMGLEWGGDWKMNDTPHFEVKTGLTMAQKRDRVAKGIPLLPDDPDEWTLYLNGKLLGELTEKGGALYYPARALLNRMYGEALVLANLGYLETSARLTWAGDMLSVPTTRNAQGTVLADVEHLAEWLALAADKDSEKRTVTLRKAITP